MKIILRETNHIIILTNVVSFVKVIQQAKNDAAHKLTQEKYRLYQEYGKLKKYGIFIRDVSPCPLLLRDRSVFILSLEKDTASRTAATP